MLTSIIVSLGTGLMATILFTIGFYRGFRPRLSVSKNISLSDEGMLYVKIANRSRLTGAYNINVHAFLTSSRPIESGTDKVVVPLENDFKEMKINMLQPNTRRYRYASHATVAIEIPDEDTAKQVVSGKFELIIQVTAVHGWSNVSGAYNSEYKLPFAIKNYPFKEGNNVDINYESFERELKIYIKDKHKTIPFKKKELHE